MYRFDKILCKTGLIPIERLTHMCKIFQAEAFVSLAIYLCGIH